MIKQLPMNVRLCTLLLFMALVTFVAAPYKAMAEEEDAPDATYHTVVKGDTLWDISAEHFEDPFTWPGLWKKNPHIRNPHLIYPGDILRITAVSIEIVERGPGAPVAPEVTPAPPEIMPTVPPAPIEGRPEAPVDVAGLPPYEEPPYEEPPYEEPPYEEPPYEEPSEVKKPVPSAPDVVPEDETAYIIPAEEEVAPLIRIVASHKMARAGFVSEDRVKAVGAVIRGVDKVKIYLHKGDEIFLALEDPGDANIGDKYAVYVEGKKVFHPDTGYSVGRLINIMGYLEITSTGNPAIAKIIVSYMEIEKDMKVRHYHAPVTEVEVTETAAKLSGYVIAVASDLNYISENDVVYVDKGSEDGLMPGNILEVFRHGEEVTNPVKRLQSIKLPPKLLGSVIIISTEKNISSGLVLKGSESIRLGDRVRTVPAMIME